MPLDLQQLREEAMLADRERFTAREDNLDAIERELKKAAQTRTPTVTYTVPRNEYGDDFRGDVCTWLVRRLEARGITVRVDQRRLHTIHCSGWVSSHVPDETPARFLAERTLQKSTPPSFHPTGPGSGFGHDDEL